MNDYAPVEPEWLRSMEKRPRVLKPCHMPPRQLNVCQWCGSDGAVIRKRWCSEQCVHEFKIRAHQCYILQMVRERDGNVCAKCGKKSHKAQVDHVIPVSKGGGACGIDGFQTLCLNCHRQKTSVDFTKQRDVGPAHGNYTPSGCSPPLCQRSTVELRDILQHITAVIYSRTNPKG